MPWEGVAVDPFAAEEEHGLFFIEVDVVTYSTKVPRCSQKRFYNPDTPCVPYMPTLSYIGVVFGGSM